MARISVIVAAYNAEKTLSEALTSVFAQTYGDWELVVADDCSTDRTAEIASGFGERVKVVRTPTNSGPSAARNLAVASANGELLAILDADDYWLPSFLEEQTRLFDVNGGEASGVGIVACDARQLLPNGTFLDTTAAERVRAPSAITLTNMLVANRIYGAVILPRRLYLDVGGESPDVVPAEDWDLWIRLLERGLRVVASRETLAVYRLSDGSLSSDLGRMARAHQHVYERALARGNLLASQRRIVRRELRLQEAVLRLDEVARRRANGEHVAAAAARALPITVVAAIEHPQRLASYVRAAWSMLTSGSGQRSAGDRRRRTSS
jgi:glycosyltransferase involved in cell wall biosynthesis